MQKQIKMENRKLTKGEKTIRTTFNPSTEEFSMFAVKSATV